MHDLSIEEVNDVEKFHSLKKAWNSLLEKSRDNNVFLTWEWLFTWWKHYGNNKTLKIIIIKESDKIISIAPLMQSKYRIGFLNIEVIENICSMNCDYSGVILTERKDESVAILLSYLGKILVDDNIVLQISHIPDSSEFLNVLQKQYPAILNSLYIDERIITSCPYIELPTKWEEYFNGLSSNRRGILRRALRSLQQNHKLELKNNTHEESLREQLKVLFDLHRKRWQLRNIKSKFTETTACEFYTDISEVFLRNNWLDFSFLNIDGKPASVIWGFNYNGKFYYMTPTFDLAYSDHKVGNVHIMKSIEYAIQRGLSVYDFLKGDEEHKSHWTNCRVDNIQIVMVKKGLEGRYLLKLLQIQKRIENIQEHGLVGSYHQRMMSKKQQRN